MPPWSGLVTETEIILNYLSFQFQRYVTAIPIFSATEKASG